MKSISHIAQRLGYKTPHVPTTLPLGIHAVTAFFLGRSHSSFLNPLELNQPTKRTLKREFSLATIHTARPKRLQVISPSCCNVPEKRSCSPEAVPATLDRGDCLF